MSVKTITVPIVGTPEQPLNELIRAEVIVNFTKGMLNTIQEGYQEIEDENLGIKEKTYCQRNSAFRLSAFVGTECFFIEKWDQWQVLIVLQGMDDMCWNLKTEADAHQFYQQLQEILAFI